MDRLPGHDGPSTRGLIRVFAILFFGSFCVFVITRPMNHTEAPDAYHFAFAAETWQVDQIRTARPLLFHLLNRSVFLVAAGSGGERAVPAIQLANALYDTSLTCIFNPPMCDTVPDDEGAAELPSASFSGSLDVGFKIKRLLVGSARLSIG